MWEEGARSRMVKIEIEHFVVGAGRRRTGNILQVLATLPTLIHIDNF